MEKQVEFRIREARVQSDGDMIVAGYVNKTEQYSEELGVVKRFREKIARGAFKRAIERASGDIDFLADHNPDLVLASTKNDTLKLEEDDEGLRMEARIINTSVGRDWFEMISSGLITNMSFGFSVIEDAWNVIEDDVYERHIEDLNLFEVSAVRTPAYAQSTIASRGLDSVDESIIPDDIIKEDNMNKEHMEELVRALKTLSDEVRELRGTMGVDKDGNDVNVQKDNYAVGQQTAKQAEIEDDLKVIKADEEPDKYYGDKEIDDKGSYNHDTKVKGIDDEGEQVNKPESEEDEKVKDYDGSDPDEVPGVQNGESDEKEEEPTEDGSSEPEVEESVTEEPVDGERSLDSSKGKSFSFDTFERRMRTLKRGYN